jgi:ABC-type uncharacterized transport system permease subunit
MKLLVGFLWPIEGLPAVLRFIGYFFPFSFAVRGLRNVIVKNATIFDFYVLMALLVQTIWILSCLSFAFWVLGKQERRKK